MIDIQEIENTYDQLISGYKTLTEMLVNTFDTQLDRKKIHGVTGRPKQLKSLIGKILDNQTKEQDKIYKGIQDITDLCGVRIITNMESDIDLIETEVRKLGFIVYEEMCKDHRDRKPNDFGYLSLHLILSVGEEFSKLDGYHSIKGLKAEIQIRSILQHAWAEMSHSFGYKSEDELPNDLKRYINRLSAVLESADLDFVRLKVEKEKYLADTKKTIDALNIGSLIENNKVLNGIRDMLNQKFGVQFSVRRNYQTIFKKLEFFKITTINTLEDKISRHHNSFVKFVDLLFERRKDNRRHILYEAPLEYFMHYLGSAKDMNYWLAYRNYEGVFCRVDMSEEVTDFIQLRKDADAAI